MTIKYLHPTKKMTKVEQLEMELTNRLMTDRAVELNECKESDYYQEYMEKEKQSFEKVIRISIAKTIFYKVETDKGNRFYVDSHEIQEGIWTFEEVSEAHFDNID